MLESSISPPLLKIERSDPSEWLSASISLIYRLLWNHFTAIIHHHFNKLPLPVAIVCSLRPGISGGRRLEPVSSVLRYVWHRDLSPVFWQSLTSTDSVASGSVKASTGEQTRAKTSAGRRRDVEAKPDRCQAGVEEGGEFTRQVEETTDLTSTSKCNSGS